MWWSKTIDRNTWLGLIISFSYFIYLVAIDIKKIILCTHDLHAGTIGNNSGMQMFENEAYGHSLTMVTPFIQGGHANATMPMFANDVYGGHLQTCQLLSSKADLLVFCLELNKMPHCQNLLESYTSMSSHFGSLNCIFLNTGWINSTLFKLFWHRNIQSSTLWCCQHRVWFFTQKGTSRWFVFERFSLFDFKYRNIYWIKGHCRQWAYPFQWIASRSRYALKKTSTWYAFEITCFYSG